MYMTGSDNFVLSKHHIDKDFMHMHTLAGKSNRLCEAAYKSFIVCTVVYDTHKSCRQKFHRVYRALCWLDIPIYISQTSPFTILLRFFFHFYLNFDKTLLANSENTDKMPPFMASGLDLHCLPMYYKKKLARPKWVKHQNKQA